MPQFLTRKILHLIPTFLGITLMAFFLIRLVPGDPVLLLLGERGANQETYERMEKTLGLDRPLPMQYLSYLGNIFRGDLGRSIISKRPVWEEFKDRFPATLELGLVGMVFAIVLGIPLGIIAAVKRNTFWDYSLMGGSLVGYSMPIFWWGLVMILIFSVNLGWTPVSGRISLMYEVPSVTGLMLIDSFLGPQGQEAFQSAFLHLLLPSFVLGTIPLAVIARMTRSSMLEVLGEDYIRTAKAKGTPFLRVVFKHAFRNALLPIVTIIGVLFGTIITGAILTETIFSWPGIGKWMVGSVQGRDYPAIQGGLLLIASMIVLINTCVDLSYGFINPKLRGKKN